MAVNIGPRIGIDGEAQFRKEISNLIQQQKTLSSELKAVTSAFDKNDKSQEAVSAQSSVLAKQIQLQYQEIGKLKQGLIQATAAFGETDSRTQKWQQSVNEATAQLNRMKSQLASLGDEAEDTGKAFESAGEKTSFFKDELSADAIVESIKGIASAISDVVSSTEEYRKIMGTLETSSAAAGYSADQTSESFYELYWALGDTQAAATATANLQALQLDQKELNNLLELSVGAWAKYGDSIPIDSLAESINETIRSGTVTGTFADVLNWGSQEGERFGVTMKANTEANKEWNDSVAAAETAEDFFNLALQDASSQAERANIVMQAMASQGLADTADAWYENNQDIVDANNAQLDFMANMAEFSDRASPVVNAVKEGFNDLLSEVLNLTEGVDFTSLAEQVQSGFSYFIDNVLPEITNFVKYIIDNKELVVSGIAGIGAAFVTWNVVTTIQGVVTAIKAFKTANEGASIAQWLLNAAMSANPIGLIISAIAGLVAGIVVLWNTNEDFRNAVIEIGKQIGEFVSNLVNTVVKFFTKTIPDAFDAVINFVKTNWQGLLLLLVNPFAGAFKLLYDNCEGFRNTIDNLVRNIKQAFEDMRNAISNTVGNIRDAIVDGIQGAVDFITELPSRAVGWGRDFIQGLVDGIWGMIGSVVDAVSNVASTITSYLHFSRPDVGPLRQYEEWMPDMLNGMAKGIRENAWQLEDALNAATSNLQTNVNVASLPASGGMNMGAVNITINAAPGMDVNALADAVAYKIQSMAQRKAAVW